ncbi:cupin domain-containing protein [Actinomycetospora flava]|uniref:Cupin domain-containing protein n=1 Tax=Actinomycetospora flava TaxID=3129232 RepID=A0ABU8MG35_9PSEU
MDKLPVDIATCECLRLGTDEIVVLMSAEQTGGALLAVQLRMPPGGGPPVMHRHAPSEIYSVISGELTFYVGDPVRRVVGGPGDVVPMAGGTPHTIRNESDADAVAFGVHAPAGPMEAFTREAHALAAGGEPRMEDVLAIAQRHGIEMLGPVPVTT